jgi:pre-mRNA-processing factor 40
MLGQPGSNPLELFWDVVEELDEILYQQRKIITEIIKVFYK